MNADELQRFEQAGHLAAAQLRPEHITDFLRLLKELRFGSRFQLLVAEFNDPAYAKEVMGKRLS